METRARKGMLLETSEKAREDGPERGPLHNINDVAKDQNSPSSLFDRLLSSPMKQPITSFKPLSYWAQKVDDLEKTKVKKSKAKDLYEFSSPDSPLKLKKTRKPKPRRKKENFPWKITSTKSRGISESAPKNVDELVKKIISSSRSQPSHESRAKMKQSKPANEIALIKERVLYKKAEEIGDSFTFEKAPIFGLSSTPSQKKQINLVKPSLFGFDSPIPLFAGEISAIVPHDQAGTDNLYPETAVTCPSDQVDCKTSSTHCNIAEYSTPRASMYNIALGNDQTYTNLATNNSRTTHQDTDLKNDTGEILQSNSSSGFSGFSSTGLPQGDSLLALKNRVFLTSSRLIADGFESNNITFRAKKRKNGLHVPSENNTRGSTSPCVLQSDVSLRNITLRRKNISTTQNNSETPASPTVDVDEQKNVTIRRRYNRRRVSDARKDLMSYSEVGSSRPSFPGKNDDSISKIGANIALKVEGNYDLHCSSENQQRDPCCSLPGTSANNSLRKRDSSNCCKTSRPSDDDHCNFSKNVTLRRRYDLRSVQEVQADVRSSTSANETSKTNSLPPRTQLLITDGAIEGSFDLENETQNVLATEKLNRSNNTLTTNKTLSDPTDASNEKTSVSQVESSQPNHPLSHSYHCSTSARSDVDISKRFSKHETGRQIKLFSMKRRSDEIVQSPPKRSVNKNEKTIISTDKPEISPYFCSPPNVSTHSSKIVVPESPAISDSGPSSPIALLTNKQPNDLPNSPSTLFTSMLNTRTSKLPKGKNHHRARNLLRNLHTGRITLHDATLLPQTKNGRGRAYELFVESVLEMQPGLDDSMKETTLQEFSGNITVRNRRSARRRTSAFVTSRPRNSSKQLENSSRRTMLERRSAFRRQCSMAKTRYSLSILDRTCLANTTLRVVPVEEHDLTDFRAAYGICNFGAETGTAVHCDETIGLPTARDVVLTRCGQEEPYSFEEYFNERCLSGCKKIGEGVYGEVFMYQSELGPAVFKVIPIEGDILVNDEPQKTFSEILSEVVISMELSNLRHGTENSCDGFTELRRVWCVMGCYPEFLQHLWQEYNERKGSENDNPDVFEEDQLYIVLELEHGGVDVEAFIFNNAKQANAAFQQAAFSLAVAERALQFEHRDFHWGNVLVSHTKEKTANFTLDGKTHEILTEGVKVSIIDFTLSRMSYDGCSVYNDLSTDPTLFTSEGDYQFEIYRFMKEETGNDWERFCPRTNVFWLHYLVDKMMTMVRYSKPKSKVHGNGVKKLAHLKSVALKYNSAATFTSAF